MEEDVSGVTVKEEINERNSSPMTSPGTERTELVGVGFMGLVFRQKLEESEFTHDEGMQAFNIWRKRAQ